MTIVVTSNRYQRLVLAFWPALFAIWFGQVTVEKIQALLGGHQVIWSEKHGVLFSGWPFVVATAVLTLLAVWSAYGTWRSRAIAWVLFAILWSAIAFIGAIHTLSQEHIAPLSVMYLVGFTAMGIVLVMQVRRLTVESRPNKSMERTRGR